MPSRLFLWEKKGKSYDRFTLKKIQTASDKPVKIINIDFCQFENSFECTGFQLVMNGNNRANFSFAGYF